MLIALYIFLAVWAVGGGIMRLISCDYDVEPVTLVKSTTFFLASGPIAWVIILVIYFCILIKEGVEEFWGWLETQPEDYHPINELNEEPFLKKIQGLLGKIHIRKIFYLCMTTIVTYVITRGLYVEATTGNFMQSLYWVLLCCVVTAYIEIIHMMLKENMSRWGK